MNEPYIRKEDELTILELVNNIVMIYEEEPIKISICDLERGSNITLTKNEIFEISQFVKVNDNGCQKLVIDNILIDVRPDWLTISIDNNLVVMRPEMFDKIIKYFEESQKIMKEGNVTQNIYNSLINTNNSQNNTPNEAKPITTGQTQTKKTIFDSVIDTMKNNLGGKENGK